VSDEPAWSVHVTFTDGSMEIARGDPEVRDGVLFVRVYGTGQTIEFEAGFPLTQVKWWWVDYVTTEGDDVMRSGPASVPRA